MKNSTIRNLIAAMALGCGAQSSLSQGSFANLDFEQANPSTLNYLPGWTSYAGLILYNTASLGGAAISLHDMASLGFQPLQGSYSVFLQGSAAGPAVSAAIGQTGQIPASSLSLRFWVDPRSNLEITFGGQVIPTVKLSSTANYDVLGGDISMFAGQTAELRFTGPANSGGYFDNIFFSNQPIPEPSALGLFGLGALLFGRRLRRSV